MQVQGGHRALRRGRVQRPLPRVGAALHRRLEPADRAHRSLDRHRRRLRHPRRRLHRVGLVVAQAGLRQGASHRGSQGRALLHALRHGAVEPRGGPGLSRRARPVGLRALPAAGRPERLPARLDDDAVDAGAARGDRRRSGRHVRARAAGRGPPDPGRVAGRAGAGRGGRDRGAHAGLGAARPALRAALPLHQRLRRARPLGVGRRLRLHRGRHRGGAHRRGLRRGRLPPGHGQRADDPQPGASRRHVRRANRAVRRDVRARRRRPDRRGAARVGPAVSRRRVRALLPALLALRHPADLLRQAHLVRPHHRAPRGAAGGQRGRDLVPRAHQARALRQVAREQRGLGAVARALLGHASADLARGRRRGGLHRLDGRVARARRRDPG